MTDLTRRSVLIAGTAAGVTMITGPLPAPEPAWTRPPQDHPFLAYQRHDGTSREPVAKILRVTKAKPLYQPPIPPEALAPFDIYYPPPRDPRTGEIAKPPIRVLTVCPTPFETPVRSLVEAEDRVLARILAEARRFDFEEYDPVRYRTWVGEWEFLSQTINRAANVINARSLRGPANTVLIHPDDLRLLDHRRTAAFAPQDPEPFGRWTRVGSLNNTQYVYTGPVPKGAVVLVQKAWAIDAPAVYTETATGRYLTWGPTGTYTTETGSVYEIIGEPLDKTAVIRFV